MKVTLEGKPPIDLKVTGIDKGEPIDGGVAVTLRLSVLQEDGAEELPLRIWLDVGWARELRNRLDATIPTASAQQRQRS
jgi:hypothetical protein